MTRPAVAANVCLPIDLRFLAEVSDPTALAAAVKGGGFASACGANLYNLRLTPFAYFPFAFHR